MLYMSISLAYTNAEHKAVKGLIVTPPRSAEGGLPGQRQLAARDRPLRHHVAAETEQLGRPPAGLSGHVSDLLHQVLLLDQPAKILLVQPPSGQRLHRALQLQQREAWRHQFEHHGAVFDLGAKPRDAGGKDTAGVVR